MPASTSWKLYLRITNLPLDKFITCLCDDDLSPLIIDGHPSEEALQEAWEAIHEEYLEKMQDDEYSDIAELTKEINLLETKFNLIQTIVKLLEFMPFPFVINNIGPELDKTLGFPVPLDPEDEVSYAHTLEGALGHGKRYWSEAQSLRMQLPPADDAAPKKVTREHFDQVIVSLSRFNKYKIVKHETTVSEYAAMVQDMRRAVASASKVQNN